jgi:pimeloyl-ACP methyl ester carboxylesterase
MWKFLKFILKVIVFIVIVIMSFVIYSKYYVERQDIHSSAPAGTKFITLENGEEMAYRHISNTSSTTIVFIGGFSGWGGTWEQSMNTLNERLRATGKRYDLIALDLPPFGYSTAKSENAYTRNIQAERINQFRKALKLDRVIYAGHSYGAGPMVEALMRKPEGVQRVIVIDGVLNINEVKIVSLPLLTASQFVVETFVHIVSHSSWIAQNRLKSFAYIDDHIDADLAALYTRAFNTVGNSSRLAHWIRDYVRDPLVYRSTRKEEYAKLTMPVRIIWGSLDTITPITLGEELKSLVPNGTLDSLSAVGHMPMIEDHDQFDSALFDAVVE